jgi:hypothetical protein
MPTARVIKAVDMLESGGLCLLTGLPRLALDQFGLDCLEERLNGGIVTVEHLGAIQAYELTCRCWTSQRELFTLHLIHQMLRLNTSMADPRTHLVELLT